MLNIIYEHFGFYLAHLYFLYKFIDKYPSNYEK